MQSHKSKEVNLLNEQSSSSSDEQLSKFKEVKLLPVTSSFFSELKFDKSKEPDKFLNDKSMLSTLPSSFQVIPVQVDGSFKSQLSESELLYCKMKFFSELNSFSFNCSLLLGLLFCASIFSAKSLLFLKSYKQF